MRVPLACSCQPRSRGTIAARALRCSGCAQNDVGPLYCSEFAGSMQVKSSPCVFQVLTRPRRRDASSARRVA
jgi:hypothetical protein